MKKVCLSILAVVAFSLSFTSCKETTEEKVIVKEVETAEPVAEEKGALERAAEKIDAEVNEEIDEEIEKIGDDN